MADPDQDQGFRVTDRRHRGESSSPPGPPSAEGPGEPGASAPEPPALGEGSVPPAEVERSLVGLFAMLGNEAFLALGGAAEPTTGQVRVDLAHASAVIDLLILLREKTDGHRTAEESEVLDQVIYDLQVRWIAATRKPGERPGPSRR